MSIRTYLTKLNEEKNTYRYYVYAYLREDGSPYYIGKGTKDRAWINHRTKEGGTQLPRNRNNIILLEINLSDIGACALERRLIRWYGRKDIGTGILHNRTDGGESQPKKHPFYHKLNLTDEEFKNILIEETNKGISRGKIAKRLGVSEAAINIWFKKLNLQRRRNELRDPEILYDLYVNQQLSAGQIGIKINCTNAAVQQYLKKFNIPIRNASERQKLSWKNPNSKQTYQHLNNH